MKPRNTKDFALVSQKVLSPSSLCPPSASLVYGTWKMPPLRRSAIARAFTSAVQFKMHAPTTLPPWQVPWGSEMADGFLQTTKPTTIIILAERSNLLFTRSGATASSLCLSHDSDFSGGRLSCDHEEENEHFSEISKHKRFRLCQPKGSFSFFFVQPFACLLSS